MCGLAMTVTSHLHRTRTGLWVSCRCRRPVLHNLRAPSSRDPRRRKALQDDFPTDAAQVRRASRVGVEGFCRWPAGVAATLRLRVAEGTGPLARTEPVPARPKRLTEHPR